MEDVPLPDPVWRGLPEFNNAPLKKHRSWRPRSPQEEDNGEVLYLMNRIKALAQSGLTIIEVMSICMTRGVQPLQYRGHPLWCFNGEDDATRCGRKGPDNAAALAKIMSDCLRERKRSSSASSHGMDSPCTTLQTGRAATFYSDPSRILRHKYLPCYFIAGTAKSGEGGPQPISTTRGP